MQAIAFEAIAQQSASMTRTQILRTIFFLVRIGLSIGLPSPAIAQPTPFALQAFANYTHEVESALANQRRSQSSFSVPATPQFRSRLRAGEVLMEEVTSAGKIETPGAMLHHWRATAFAAGARASDLDLLLRSFSAYPARFAPQVLSVREVQGAGDHFQIVMRVRQKHVLTVVIDTRYDVQFGRQNAQAGSSDSQSQQIQEIDSAGTAQEHVLKADQEHGFLWRQNTYWSYREADGGVYVQVDSVSLSRAIPAGLGWALRPYVTSIPQESLEFALRSACNGIKH